MVEGSVELLGLDNERLGAERDGLTANHARWVREVDAASERRDQTIEGLRREVASLNAEVDGAEEDAESLLARLTKQEEAMAALLGDAERMQGHVEAMQRDRDALAAEVQELRLVIEGQWQHIEELGGKVPPLSGMADDRAAAHLRALLLSPVELEHLKALEQGLAPPMLSQEQGQKRDAVSALIDQDRHEDARQALDSADWAWHPEWTRLDTMLRFMVDPLDGAKP